MYKGSTGIAPEGFSIILLFMFLGWLCAYFNYNYLSAFFFIFTIFNIFFFRDPERDTVDDDDVIVSPADGKIVEIKQDEEPYFLNENRLRVSIFLSILDCHINRFPIEGKVLSTKYKKGEYGLAYKPEASSNNESLATLIGTKKDFSIVMVQIAGLLARRIISYADVDKELKTGERFGIIRYGSRVDLYIPEDFEVKVSTGQRVKGGETIIACLKEEKK